jgi:diadenosine tetraphosphate (Ap4A) HIT family hydrolase
MTRNYMNESSIPGCELCDSTRDETLWHDDSCRVILVPDPDYPGYCRVILNRHVREMTDLDISARERLMRVVFAAESAVRRVLHPDKINLASLGNMVPHLHWHVIPRFADDRHFPNSVWGAPKRAGAGRKASREAIAAALHELLAG